MTKMGPLLDKFNVTAADRQIWRSHDGMLIGLAWTKKHALRLELALNITSNLPANSSHTASNFRIAVAVGAISTMSSAYARAPTNQQIYPENSQHLSVVKQAADHRCKYRRERD